MAKPPRPWIVTAHEPIEKHDDNLWSVQSRVPGVPFSRRMTIVKRSDGTLLFYHAVPLDEPSMAEVCAWGKPAVLIIPHDNHGLDAAPFAQKLGLKIYGPARQISGMSARWEMAGAVEDLPADPAIRFEAAAGTKSNEPIGIATTNGRVSLLFADAYQDSRNLNLPLRMLGFGNGPKVVPAFKWLFTFDRAALKAHLARLAELPGLTRIVPCHGPVLEVDAPATLRRVAAAA